ncbi:stage II sporulation protein M [Peribacillus muralis]|uniref:stage II sporulation protein M n=1 Tax=Peribacillus muralis TaxID=264697 RepID=UPI003D02DB08
MLSTMPKIIVKRAVKFFLFAAAITIIATILTYIINPDLKELMEGVKSRLPNQVKESTGIDKFWSFIFNNGFMVPLQMLILALVPIQFLYVVNIISTVSLPGILFGVVLQVNFNKGFAMIISTIPHFVFEVFALCLLAAVLFELNQVVRVKISNIFKKDKKVISFIKKFLETIRTYAIFVLPIIIVAAFLETYIADIIFNLFQ